MKKTIAILIPLTFLMICVLSMRSELAFAAEDNPAVSLEGSVGESISWDHWSPCCVVETITDLGGGTWRYSYEFINTDTEAIWHFAVSTQFTTSALTPFDQPGWDVTTFIPSDSLYPCYDARNLDPAIVGHSNTWGNPWEFPSDAIDIGEAASGFSFEANVYDPSPKYFMYEFVGTYAAPEAPVTAVGLTGPPGHVIPDVPLGTIMAGAAMIFAFVAYIGTKHAHVFRRP